MSRGGGASAGSDSVAQASSVATSRARQSKRAPSGASRRASRPRLGRWVVIVLVIIAAAIYIAPLRDFFAQQDRYHTAAAELRVAKTEHTALAREADLLVTKAYIAQCARSDSMLVPPNTQVFVIKGLPGKDEEQDLTTDAATTQASISVLDRLEDLWRTLLH